MSPAGLSWLQTLVGGVVASLLVAAIIRVCVWCWRKCCINAEVVPNNADRSDASHYSRVEEGRSNLLLGNTIRSESVPQGPEGSPLTEQEQDEDSRQGAVEPEREMYPLEADGRPRTGLAKHIGHSGHEFQLQDVQGQNDIEPEERPEEPDGSLGTRQEQDGQSGQEVLPLATHDEHSEGLQLRSWVARRLQLRYWVAPQALATQLGH